MTETLKNSKVHTSLHLKVPELTSLKTRSRRFTTIYSFTTIVKFTKFPIIHKNTCVNIIQQTHAVWQYEGLDFSFHITFDTT